MFHYACITANFMGSTLTYYIIVTHPGEYRVLKNIESCEKYLGTPVIIKPDHRFLCETKEFSLWVKNRKNLRMEYFYREMRKKYSILMDGNKPIGSKWNYDHENRKSPPKEINIPKPYHAKIDNITREVLQLVARKFPEHFGDLEPFYFAVTREQALEALRLFIKERLCNFGDYQDAMLEGEPWMYHSHISFYLNCGLLLPLECIRAAEHSYHKGLASLNAV